MRDRSALTELLKRARVRHLALLLADQTSFSLALVMGAAIILLLAGTELLAWYWLAVIFGVGLAAGIWRVSRRLPSTYRLAQRLDRGLGLDDSLSTAYYFGRHPGSSDPAIRAEQQRRAEDAARKADLRAALPFSAPKSIYWTAGLAMAAFGLVGIRYGITRTMDLRQGMVKIAFDNFFSPTMRVARAKKPPLSKKIQEELKKAGINVETPETAKAQDPAPDSALNVVDEPNLETTEPSVKKADAKSSQDKGNDPEANGENPENAAPGDKQAAEENSPPTGKGAQQNDKEASGGKQQSNGGDENSLMDKMRDAMANLMNKLKTPPRAGDGRTAPANSQNGNLQSRGSRQMAKQGGEENGRQSSDSSDPSQQQGNPQQQSQNGQNTQAAQGKSGDRSTDRPPSQDAKSGIGRQDGDKSAREAADLAAMGKISEIIGKRSANLTGEVMVDVPGGKQQLKTPYAERSATHGESGGDINRDEVPLIYQQYVEQYFEEIRKAPPAASLPAPRTKAGEGPPIRNKAIKAEE